MNASAIRCALASAGLLLLAAPLRADTIKVPQDHETIQAALDVAVDGDIVQVSKGVYAENVVMAVAGVTLKGKGATINGRYQGNCVTVNANDVTVESLTIVNGGGSPPVDGDPTGGVFATGTGITLSKLTIRACADFGIQLVGTGTIESCKVDACFEDGINVDTDNPGNSTPTIINKNTVTRCANGILADGGPFTVTSNTCEQNDGEGIEVNSPPPAEGALPPAGTNITKNKANDNGGTGIIIGQAVAIEPLVLFEKNTMDGNGAGCEIEGFSVDAKSNTIQNSRGDGLVVGDQCNVEKNKVKGNLGRGIDVEGDGNTLVQNTVQDNGADGINVGGDGNTIDKNTVKDSVGDGIEIQEGADGNTVIANKVSGSEHDGIDNSGLLTVIVDNNSKSNGGADIAGAGIGGGTVDAVESIGNVVSDDSDIVTFLTLGELDLN